MVGSRDEPSVLIGGHGLDPFFFNLTRLHGVGKIVAMTRWVVRIGFVKSGL